MKLNVFWFVFLFILSIMLIPLIFQVADLERGYNATGGEVFTIALPYLVLKWRIWTVEQIEKEKMRRYTNRLAKNLK
jgi:hypothetical protein